MKRKRTLLALGIALAAVAILMLVAGGVVLAQPPNKDRQNNDSLAQIFVDKLAVNLDMKPDELKEIVKKTEYQMVEDAVGGGKIPAEQADKIRERIDKGDLFFTMPNWGAIAKERAFQGKVQLAALGAAAGALDLQPKDLLVQLRNGKSIQQLADEKKLDGQHVKDAITQAVRKVVDQSVAAGQITKQQGDKMVDNFTKADGLPKWLSASPAPGNKPAPKPGKK